MKKIKVRNLSLIILSIILMFCLTTNVLATDLIDVTSNSTGKTNTTNIDNTADVQNITQIDTPTFSTVTQTVYAKNNTNIKSSYTTTASNLGTLAKDQSIKRTGMSSNGWSRVEMSNGTIGYVLSEDLTTTAPNTTQISNTNTSVYNNTNNNTNTLPQTGIGDNTGMYIIMGICVLSAIYAYKKIRDYNI